MNDTFDIPRLLELRKLTRSLSEQLESELKRHLATLAPLFSPLPIFGDHVRGGSKVPIRGAEKNFEELRNRFRKISTAKPFVLSGDIEAPVDLFSATPLLTPVKYPYQAKDDGKITEVTVTSPLKWVLSYPDAGPSAVRALLEGNRNQVKEELRHCLLQNLALELILEKQTGLLEILKGLRFAVDSTRIGALGDLPVIQVSCPISTLLPPDAIIIQNTEISGVPSFEEVIDVEDIRSMQDPFRQAILVITERESPGIFREVTQ
ncbi:MAG: hypothetical protein KDI43_04070 [Gammaproteobacteria bacterium]|nr:hypothetical protein [Gammaproteobacteria bacterium]MCP5410412.1 hypothetical protein [Chromatiaceae bacterium]MCP5444567.1 hypothetical protein [Chromatiaceae bacterium]